MAEQIDLVSQATVIVSSYVSNNPVALSEIDGVIRSVHDALRRLGTPQAVVQCERQQPAVPIADSIQPDHLVNLFNGRRFKMLKSTLARNHGMTPREYRAYWGLPGNYPMVAPNYSTRRRAIAKAAGLGSRIKPGASPFLIGDGEEPAHVAAARNASEKVETPLEDSKTRRNRGGGTLDLKI